MRRALEAQAFGATEVCIQAGLAPGVDARFYVDLVPRAEGGRAGRCTSTPSRPRR